MWHVLTVQDCLALGAIFATTDSVAVLQVLEQDRAPLLFNLVFGEGVINDATTVALLRTVQVRQPIISADCETRARPHNTGLKTAFRTCHDIFLKNERCVKAGQ
jgi:hypothetical protein